MSEPQGEDVVMQTRCVACLHDQWAPAVFDVSFGERGCAWCGHVSRPLTEAEYRVVLRQRYLDVAHNDEDNE
jgi:hypothetical protein